jgi:hypothetical protein
MPDFGAPIAQNVDVSPNKGLQTLSDLMGLQQKQIDISQARQNLATGAFIQQQQQASAQQQQAAMNTRMAATKMAQTGMDPDGNPIRGDDGEIDPVKFSASLNRIDPVNAAPIVQNILKTTNDKLNVQSGALKLDAQQRSMLQGPMQALNLDPSDDNITNVRSVLGGLLQQHPEMSKTVAAANGLLDHVANNPDPATRKKMANSFSALFQAGAPVETQPSAVQMDTGQIIQPGVREAPGAGGGFIPGGAPIAKQLPIGSQYFDTASGQTKVVSGPGRSLPAAPTLGQVQAIGGSVDAINDDWKQTVASATSAPRDIAILQTIKQLAPAAATGLGAQRKLLLDKLAGALNMTSAQMQATATDELAKNQNMLALAGGNTDAARSLAELANPNWHMTKDAITGTADQLIGQRAASVAKMRYLQPAKNAADAGNRELYQAGLERWSDPQSGLGDPRVHQYSYMSPDEKATFKRSMSPADQAAFRAKLGRASAAGLLPSGSTGAPTQ